MITLTRQEADREHLFSDLVGATDTEAIDAFIEWCEINAIPPVENPQIDMFGRYAAAARAAGWRILFRIVPEPRPLSAAAATAALATGSRLGTRHVTVEATSAYDLDVDADWWDEVRAGRAYDDPGFADDLAAIVEARGFQVEHRRKIIQCTTDRSV
jgi:hypothetical protein